MQTLTRHHRRATLVAAPAPALQVASAKNALQQKAEPEIVSVNGVTRDRLLRLAEVQNLTGLGRSTIYEMGNKGNFPKQIRLSSRCAVWPESAVLQWVQTQIQGAK